MSYRIYLDCGSPGFAVKGAGFGGDLEGSREEVDADGSIPDVSVCEPDGIGWRVPEGTGGIRKPETQSIRSGWDVGRQVQADIDVCSCPV